MASAAERLDSGLPNLPNGESLRGDDAVLCRGQGLHGHPVLRVQPTPRQRQALAFVVNFVTESGYPPTCREIGRHMGIRGTNGVVDHLRALGRKGFIARGEYGRSRDLRVTPAGYNVLGLEAPEVVTRSGRAPSTAPIVEVNQGWLCPRCKATTFAPDKPCAFCAILKQEKAE